MAYSPIPPLLPHPQNLRQAHPPPLHTPAAYDSNAGHQSEALAAAGAGGPGAGPGADGEPFKPAHSMVHGTLHILSIDDEEVNQVSRLLCARRAVPVPACVVVGGRGGHRCDPVTPGPLTLLTSTPPFLRPPHPPRSCWRRS